MFLITSAAYLSAEFTAEFGALPPAFLPLGHKRLYELQHASIGAEAGPVVLSLPDDFQVLPLDQAMLDRLGIRVLRVPVGLTLGASVLYCLERLLPIDGPLHILHGDTYLPQLSPARGDAIAVAETSEYCQWAECETDANGRIALVEGLPAGPRPRQVVCGYFAFSDPDLLARSIAREGNRFIRGVAAYGRERAFEIRKADAWYDLGHIQLYYQSKARLATRRCFNALAATPRFIEKSSDDARKIEAEARWYENLPPDLAVYAPRFLGRAARADGKPAYRTEYLYLAPLSELYVYGRLPVFVWANIFAKCEEFFALARAHRPPQPISVRGADYRAHALRRLEEFARGSGIPLDAPCRLGGRALPALRTIVEELAGEIADAGESDIGIWHGDFCFSNMLYDFRAEHLRLIDPRGLLFDGTISIFGDMRYDLAKLAHSVIGRYDFILCSRYALKRNGVLDFDLALPANEVLSGIEAEFRRLLETQHRASARAVLAMTASLFFSMLPLHDDDPERQLALLANGLRLYAETRA